MAKPKNKGGRPSKYKEEYNQAMIEFFDVNPYEVQVIDDKAYPARFPTFARFALSIGVCTDTLWEWAHGRTSEDALKHPEFSDTYKKAKEYQEAYLYEAGISGLIDRTFGIWATKTLLGHKEPEKDAQVIDTDVGKIKIEVVGANADH